MSCCKAEISSNLNFNTRSLPTSSQTLRIEQTVTMANSPLVAYPQSALHPNHATSQPPSTAPSPLRPKPPAGAAVAPSDGTSTVQVTAEQLNDAEKRKYIKGKKLGEGTYANVYLGSLRSDPSQLVAIKKIKFQKESAQNGLAPDAVREIKYLQELSHPNIITLLSVFTTKDQNLNIILEFLPLGDLEGLIKDTAGIPYGPADVKAWMGMLCRAVWFCHDNFVLHRDIKPNNCLIASDGTVKLADFGLARSFADAAGARPMTANVITIWYRPPELLFGAPFYSGAVDIWSVGVLFAELITRAAYLPGQTEVEQISLICRTIGTPTDEVWPGVTKLPHYAVPEERFPVHPKEVYMQRFGSVGDQGVDLLMRMLILDPRKRITAREMMEHRWWRTEPKPTRLEDLPRNLKQGNPEKFGADQGRQPGVVEDKPDDRGGKVARRLDFGGKK